MILLILITWILCAFFGYTLGKERTIGEGGGFALGLLLGFVGVIIVACFPKVESNTQADAGITSSYVRIEDEKMKQEMAADELKKWYELKNMGAITNEEFEEKKRNLIK